MKLIAILRIKNAISTAQECFERLSDLVDEIIVLDNGSEDGTLDIYKKFPKIKNILHTEGYHEGRDKLMLLEAAKARNPDWIIWIDADEIFEKNLTRAVLEKYMNSKYDIVGFRACNFWLDRKHFRIDGTWFRYTMNIHRTMWRNLPSAYFKDQQFHNGLIRGINSKMFISPYRLKHYGYADRQEANRKIKFYNENDITGRGSNVTNLSRAWRLPFWEFDNRSMNYIYIIVYKFFADAGLNLIRFSNFLKRLYAKQ